MKISRINENCLGSLSLSHLILLFHQRLADCVWLTDRQLSFSTKKGVCSTALSLLRINNKNGSFLPTIRRFTAIYHVFVTETVPRQRHDKFYSIGTRCPIIIWSRQNSDLKTTMVALYYKVWNLKSNGGHIFKCELKENSNENVF